MVPEGMYTINRDKKICLGLKSCGKCTYALPGLAHGYIRMAAWAMEHNERRVAEAISLCPANAIMVSGGPSV